MLGRMSKRFVSSFAQRAFERPLNYVNGQRTEPDKGGRVIGIFNPATGMYYVLLENPLELHNSTKFTSLLFNLTYYILEKFKQVKIQFQN